MLLIYLGIIWSTTTIICSDILLLHLVAAKTNKRIEGIFRKFRRNIYRKGFTEIKIYYSKKFNSNVYLSHPYLGKPSIIIGEEILNELSDEKILAVLAFALKEFSEKNFRFKTFMAVFRYAPEVFVHNQIIGRGNLKQKISFLKFLKTYLIPIDLWALSQNKKLTKIDETLADIEKLGPASMEHFKNSKSVIENLDCDLDLYALKKISDLISIIPDKRYELDQALLLE